MTENMRDTKFLGFANLVMEEMGDDISNLMDECADAGNYSENMELIIARRAYDLAFHVATSLDSDIPWRLWRETTEQVIEHDIPDLTQWPDSPGSE